MEIMDPVPPTDLLQEHQTVLQPEPLIVRLREHRIACPAGPPTVVVQITGSLLHQHALLQVHPIVLPQAIHHHLRPVRRHLTILQVAEVVAWVEVEEAAAVAAAAVDDKAGGKESLMSDVIIADLHIKNISPGNFLCIL